MTINLSLVNYLTTSNTSRTAAASLFGGSSSNTTSSSLLGSSGSGSDSSSASLLGGSTPSYAFTTDNTGRPIIATMADMAAVKQPQDKLTIAAQVAEAIRMQTDCSVQTGRTDRLADMTQQAQTLMDSVSAVVSGVATGKGTSASNPADPGVTPFKDSISTVLGRVASVLSNLKMLTAKAAPAVASQTTATLSQLNTTAAGIAASAGLDWSAIAKAGSPAASAAATTTPRLIDYLV